MELPVDLDASEGLASETDQPKAVGNPPRAWQRAVLALLDALDLTEDWQIAAREDSGQASSLMLRHFHGCEQLSDVKGCRPSAQVLRFLVVPYSADWAASRRPCGNERGFLEAAFGSCSCWHLTGAVSGKAALPGARECVLWRQGVRSPLAHDAGRQEACDKAR